MFKARILCIILISTAGRSWQSPQRQVGGPTESADAGRAFEVVSIKPYVPGLRRNGFGDGKRIQIDPSGLRMRTASLEEIIMYAYSLTWYGQLVEVPQGLGAYDIDAETPVPSTVVEEKTMLRAALADRFRLVCHWEKRDGRGYTLAISGRTKLQPDSEEGDAESRLVAEGEGALSWSFRRISMAAFSEWLAARVDGPVADRTDLTGRYDFKLMRPRSDPDSDHSAATKNSGGGFGVSDWIALLGQLGLRLTQSRALLDILVVDHVEKPSAN
jgi:uncharacterized protein (TIGR03435 family)